MIRKIALYFVLSLSLSLSLSLLCLGKISTLKRIMSVCSIFCKGQWSKVVCKLAKGMWLQVFLLYFLAGWICISHGARLSVICSSRLNLHFSGYWAEYYMLPIANSWIVPRYAISESIGLQAGLFTVAFFFFPLESWGLQRYWLPDEGF